MQISTTQRLRVPTAKPMRHTQTLRNRPGASNGDGCVRTGRAPQGCHGFLFFFYVNFRMKSSLFLCRYEASFWSCVFPSTQTELLCKLLDYTLSKVLCFMSTGHLSSCQPLETPADELFPVVVVEFLVQYKSTTCFYGHDGFCLIDRSIRDFLPCPDLRGDMELFLLPSKINLALSGQRSDYLPSLTPPSTTHVRLAPLLFQITPFSSVFPNFPHPCVFTSSSPPPPPPPPVLGAVK